MTALLVSRWNRSFYFDFYYNRYFISSVDSAGLLKNDEDISESNKLQPGVQHLIHSIFGEDSDTKENRSVRESSANLNTTPIANNLPPIPTTNEFDTASLENNEKESPTSNSSRLDADALSIGRQLYIEYFILIIILIFFTY